MLTMVGQFAVFFLCFRELYGYIFFKDEGINRR